MTKKVPSHFSFTDACFRQTLDLVWNSFRELAKPEVFAACKIEDYQVSTRPGLMSNFQRLKTPVGDIRIHGGQNIEIEISSPQSLQTIVTVPYKGFRSLEVGATNPKLPVGRARNPLKVLRNFINALDVHLEQEIISLEGHEATIGSPEVEDPIALSAIAAMLHIHQTLLEGRSPYSHKAYGKISAPFMRNEIDLEAYGYSSRLDFETINKIRNHYYLAIKPRIHVAASMPQWRGVKLPIYHWNLDFRPVQAESICQKHWLNGQPAFDEDTLKAAYDLADQLDISMPVTSIQFGKAA